MSYPGLKAGLIGGAALILLNLLSLVPAVGVLTCCLGVIAYIVIGALAGYWLAPRREAGQAARQGALAGLIASFMSGVASTLLAPVGVTLSGGPEAFVRQLPPESIQSLEAVGLDPYAMFSPGMFAGLTAICCLPLGLIVGAGLGALGGFIVASAKPE